MQFASLDLSPHTVTIELKGGELSNADLVKDSANRRNPFLLLIVGNKEIKNNIKKKLPPKGFAPNDPHNRSRAKGTFFLSKKEKSAIGLVPESLARINNDVYRVFISFCQKKRRRRKFLSVPSGPAISQKSHKKKEKI